MIRKHFQASNNTTMGLFCVCVAADIERGLHLVQRLQQRTGTSGRYEEELKRLQDTLKSPVFQELTDPKECARRSETPDAEVAAICGVSIGSGSSSQGKCFSCCA